MTAKPAFTPGPWEYQKQDTELGPSFMVTAQDDAGTYAICEIHEDCKMDERAPTARLIAAAPDMYEALKQAQVLLDELVHPNTTHNGTVTSQHYFARCVETEFKARAALAKVQP